MSVGLMEQPATSVPISPRFDAPSVVDEVVIQPRRGWIGIEWGELFRFRELLYFLAWRDFKVKYKQAVLGVAWSVIVPLLSLAIYAVVASFAGGKNTLEPSTPLVVWMFAGLIPWLFIQRAITDGGASLLNNQALMTKVYLPRVYLPAASCTNALIDMAINFALLSVLGLYFHFTAGFTPGWGLLALPLLMLLAWVAGLGVALFLSSATVLYRDLRFLTPFLAQFGMWFSAVALPLELFGKWQWLFAINPFTGIVYGFRSAITGEPCPWLHLGTAVAMSVGLLIFGLFYFRRVERRFADIA
jgi:lipopolysaccharide transport system permease protein